MQAEHNEIVKVKEEEMKEMEQRVAETYEHIQKAKLNLNITGFNYQNQNLLHERK